MNTSKHIDVHISRFKKEREQDVIDLIVNIQRKEFDLPITAADTSKDVSWRAFVARVD